MKEASEYIITEDTTSLLTALSQEARSPQLRPAIDQYFTTLSQALAQTVASSDQQTGLKMETFREIEIETQLGQQAKKALKKNPQAVILCLDRFLLAKMETDYPKRFYRLQLTRTVDGSKSARAGQPQLETQIKKLVSQLEQQDLIMIYTP